MSYTFTDLMKEVLRLNKSPMKIKDMWDFACKEGLDKKLTSIGKTPKNTMSSCLRKDIAKGDKAIFKQVSEKPSLYDLK